MSYVYGLTSGNAESRIFLFAAQSFAVSQLCVNTLPATKTTLIINGI
jgi:hypothetical protein